MDIEVSDEYFKLFSRLINEKSGINIHDGKRQLLKARIAKILRAEKFDDYKQLYKKVKEDKSERYLDILINAVSTNETYFFREDKHFEFISTALLNELEENKKEQIIRCWSAGCSSGEEVYSIAISILENIKNPEKWNIKILGTDICYDVLRKASRGIYESSKIRYPQNSVFQKYFTRINGSFKVSNRLKNLVTFKYLNLTEPFPFKNKIDFIFCRNVMIYFEKDTKQRLIERFYDCLTDDGYLFVGLSENLISLNSKFKRVITSVYRK